MTATSPLNYRKTKQGEWVAFGPASLIHAGTVEVLKRDGTTKSETIERVGRTFQVDGINCAYGYLAKHIERPTGHAPVSHSHNHRSGRAECSECGAYGPAGQPCRECFEGTFCL